MRDYKKEYAKYQSSEIAKKRRAERNAARREAIKKYGKSALVGKEIDHLSTNPGGHLSNGDKNLKVVDASINRGRNNNSWRKTKKRNS